MTTPQKLKELEDLDIAEAEAVGLRLTHTSGADNVCGQLSICIPIEEAERLADLLDAAAAALRIAYDWNLAEVDIPPPPGCEGTETQGWCSVSALAKKLCEGRDARKAVR
jgi:hypothetical protein